MLIWKFLQVCWHHGLFAYVLLLVKVHKASVKINFKESTGKNAKVLNGQCDVLILERSKGLRYLHLPMFCVLKQNRRNILERNLQNIALWKPDC